MKINIDFYTTYQDEENIKKYEQFLEKYEAKINLLIENALRLENINALNTVYIGIGVVPRDEIHDINKKYRNVDRETDVLSFPIYSREEVVSLKNKTIDEDVSLGDLVLCMDVIKEHSIEYETGFDREMLYMITHGTCHLLGFDHEVEEEKQEMRKREEEILKNIEY